MHILLIKDGNVIINLKEVTHLLNSICNTATFEYYPPDFSSGDKSEFIDLEPEVEKIFTETSKIIKDFTIYLTNRRYRDNFFFYTENNVQIISFYGWEYLTNLPKENGLLHFISDYFAFRVGGNQKHEENTGCINDFLSDKTGIDSCMKRGFICDNCLQKIKEKIGDSKNLTEEFADLIKILNVLSNASKWEKNVIEIDTQEGIIFQNWSTFEDDVAHVYRKLGGIVKQNVSLAGFQIDIVLDEETASKQKITSIIECKFSTKIKIGNQVVNNFLRVLRTLKENQLADKGIIVSNIGFSKDASLVAKAGGIELIKIDDLKARAKLVKQPFTTITHKDILTKKIKIPPKKIIEDKEKEIKNIKNKSPEIFVIMPFNSSWDDLYFFGIHETAKKLDYSCDRVDQMEFNGNILEKIYDSILNSKIIIAEISDPNPNVYYELGYSHAMKKLVIPIIKKGATIPFDLKVINCIQYENIIDLRNKLLKRIEAALIKESIE